MPSGWVKLFRFWYGYRFSLEGGCDGVGDDDGGEIGSLSGRRLRFSRALYTS